MTYILDRRMLLPIGIVVLVVSIGGGLARFGIDLGASNAAISAHGALAVFGFFGMLVSLERGVVLRRRWTISAPLSAFVGSVLVLCGAELLASIFWATSAALTALIILHIGRGPRGLTLAYEQMLVGCAAWCIAALLWAAHASLAVFAPFVSAFLLMTIIGERTQIGQLSRRPFAFTMVRILEAVLVLALIAVLINPGVGTRMMGLIFVVYAAWLLYSDVRMRSARPGLPRFLRLTMVGSLFWLAAAGGLWIRQGTLGMTAGSDAAIHALLIGFVMSMVFAHAPMAFPAISRMRVPYYRMFALHVWLLHVGLTMRVAGDIAADTQLARDGAFVTAASIIWFLVATIASACAAAAGYAPARQQRGSGVISQPGAEDC